MYEMSYKSPWQEYLLESDQSGNGKAVEGRREERTPSIEIHKDENEYSIFAEIPGVKKDDLKISVDGDKLTFSGQVFFDNVNLEKTGEKNEKKDKNEENQAEKKVVYSEFQNVRSYQRTLVLDVNHFELNKVKAELKDGILKLSIPLKEKSKPKKIEVA